MRKANIITSSMLFLLLILAVTFSTDASAQDMVHKRDKMAKHHHDKIMVKVQGENFCLGCKLKKEEGAMSQCSTNGCQEALKVTKAFDKDGNELKMMKGTVFHYLVTDKSKELVKKFHGKKVSVEGIVYPDETVLEVRSFKEITDK